jgi:Tol biopolymer transport system component
MLSTVAHGQNEISQDAPPNALVAAIATPTDAVERNFTIMNVRKLSGRIAFSATVDERDQIFVLDLNAGKVRTVINGPGNNSYPSWSPDGKRLAFASDRDGNREIYVSDWDGANQMRITQNIVADENPSWGNSNDEVIFYRDRNTKDNADSNIVSYTISSGTESILTNFRKRNTTPRVSPVDGSIAYSTSRFWPGWDVCVWSRTRNSEQCLLSGTLSYCRAAWSPSGKYLAYSVGTLNMIDIGYLNIEDGDKTTLTELSGKEYDPTWSPSEGLIAFVSEAEQSGVFNLYITDLQKKVTPILKSQYSIRYPSWSAAKTLQLEAARIREQELAESAQAAELSITPEVATALPTVEPAAALTP